MYEIFLDECARKYYGAGQRAIGTCYDEHLGMSEKSSVVDPALNSEHSVDEKFAKISQTREISKWDYLIINNRGQIDFSCFQSLLK